MSEKPPKIKVVVDPSIESHAENLLTPEEGRLLDERIADATIPADEVIKDAETGEPVSEDIQALLKDFGKGLKEGSIQAPQPEHGDEDDIKKDARRIFDNFFFNRKDAEEKAKARFDAMRQKLASLEVDDAERSRLSQKLDKLSEVIYGLRHRTEQGPLPAPQRQRAERLIIPLMSAGVIEPKRQRASRNVDVQTPVAEAAPSTPAEPVAVPVVESSPEPVVEPVAPEPAPVAPDVIQQPEPPEHHVGEKENLLALDNALIDRCLELEKKVATDDELKELLSKVRDARWDFSFDVGKKSKEAKEQRTQLKKLLSAIEARELEVGKTTVTPTQPAENLVASVPVMITREQRQMLADLGYSLKDISKMKPAEAHALVAGGQKKPEPVPAPVEPPPEPQFRMEERIEKIPDGIELSADEIGQEVKKLIGELAEVKSFNIIGSGNEFKIETDLKYKVAFVAVNFGLSAVLKSGGGKVDIHDVEVRAESFKEKIENKIKDALPGLMPKITEYLAKKYGKTVTGLSIKEGKLKVQFPDQEKIVEVRVPVAPKVAQAKTLTGPAHQAKEIIQATPSPYMAPEMYQAVVQSQPSAPEAAQASSAESKEDDRLWPAFSEEEVSTADMEQAEDVFETTPAKDKPALLRGIAGFGFTAQVLKSQGMEKAVMFAGQKTKSNSFMGRVVREVATRYHKDAETAQERREMLYEGKGKMRTALSATQGTGHLARLGVLAARAIFSAGSPLNVVSSTFNPFRTVGLGLLAAGKGLDVWKEAHFASDEHTKNERLEKEQAREEALSIANALEQKYQGVSITSEAYTQEYIAMLPTNLLKRLNQGVLPKRGINERLAQRSIEKSLKDIEAKIAKAKPDERKKLAQLWQTKYLRDIDRLVERDGKIDLLAYTLRRTSKAAKIGSTVLTAEALAHMIFQYDSVVGAITERIEGAPGKTDDFQLEAYRHEMGISDEEIRSRWMYEVGSGQNIKDVLRDQYSRHINGDIKGAQRDVIVGDIQKSLELLSPKQLVEAGISSGDINDLREGDKLDILKIFQQDKHLGDASLLSRAYNKSLNIVENSNQVVGTDQNVIADSVETVEAPSHLVESIPIGKRGPEGAIIDYFVKNPNAAKDLKWDEGKESLKTWAGREAHRMWHDHAVEVLKTDATKEQLSKLGYSQDLDGYAKMMTRIKSGGVELNLENKGVALTNVDYLHAAQANVASAVDHVNHHGTGSVPDDIQYTNGVEHLQAVGSGAVPDDVQYGTGHEVIDRNLPHVETDAHDAVPDLGDHAPGESRWEQHIAERVEQAPLEQTPLTVASIDTSGMSLVEAVNARFQHDLSQVFNVDEQHSEWHQWRGFGAKRLLNLNAGETSQAGRLQEYVKMLGKESGVQPRGFWFPEKVQNYIQRALKIIEEKKRG